MSDQPLLLDSITDADGTARGRVVLCGSHGGLYPGAVASGAGVRAVVFNDAGIGLDRAGVAGVLALERAGMAAAAVDCQSCHIGSAADTQARGIISVANALARALGVTGGQPARQAATLLDAAPQPHGILPPVDEARHMLPLGDGGGMVACLDSASLVGARDAGGIVVTGSHGALVGGDPARAIKAPVRVAVFNDAGFGRDGIGTGRLPALGARGIAAVTVSCHSARIGDARSALESGVISCLNPPAGDLGARTGMALAAWLGGLAG